MWWQQQVLWFPQLWHLQTRLSTLVCAKWHTISIEQMRTLSLRCSNFGLDGFQRIPDLNSAAILLNKYRDFVCKIDLAVYS